MNRSGALVCLGTAVILFVDQIGRLWLALLPLNLGNEAWRLVSIQLVATQLTPTVIALVLLAVGLTLLGRSLQILGRVLVVGALLFGVGSVMLIVGTGTVLSDTTLSSPESFRKASMQAVGSLVVGLVIFLWAGVTFLRLPPQHEPVVSEDPAEP